MTRIPAPPASLAVLIASVLMLSFIMWAFWPVVLIVIIYGIACHVTRSP